MLLCIHFVSPYYHIPCFILYECSYRSDFSVSVGKSEESFAYFPDLHQFEEAFYSNRERLRKNKGHQILFEYYRKIFQNSSLVTYPNYRHIYGAVSINQLGISPQSPFQSYWTEVKRLPPVERDPMLHKLVPVLSQVPRDLVRVESSKGSGMYPLDARISHSCTPNCIPAFNSSDYTMELIALRDIQKGEQLLQSHVDPQLPLNERKLWLKVQFLLECSCVRCGNTTGNTALLIQEHKQTHQEHRSDETPFTEDYRLKRCAQEDADVNLLLSLLELTTFPSMEHKKELIHEALNKQVMEILSHVKHLNEDGIFDETAMHQDNCNRIGYSVLVAPSTIEGAGDGVFMQGRASKGRVIVRIRLLLSC